MDNNREMTWIKIDRDENGYATNECISEMYKNLPVAVVRRKQGELPQFVRAIDKATSYIMHNVQKERAYTHYLPIPKLEV